MNIILQELLPLIKRLNEVSKNRRINYSSPTLNDNGFQIAHRVIDKAIKLMDPYSHHLVTKATFYRIKLK